MSIETLLAANIKATEALTEALTALVPALGAAAGKKKAGTTTTSAVDPAAGTGAAPSGAAAGSAAGASVVDYDTFADAVTAFAKAHGKDTARAAINKFGAEGRASNIKEVDRNAAYAAVQAEHKRLDAVKAAAVAATAGGDDLT